MSTQNNLVARKGQPEVRLSQDEFKARYQTIFFDPSFNTNKKEIERITETAWQNYSHHRKAPLTAKAGPEFKDPEYELSTEWSETRRRLLKAQENHATTKTRALVICASPRNEHTCPSEESKTFRLARHAIKTLHQSDVETDFLDLSRITAEYGKHIHPCKACVSTAMPLCHWPCSCYPNHALGQTQDWMSEIYEKWVLAHGVMILTPVHWYGPPSPLKLMMDRLVCADGGNPDPTSTHGKKAEEAKKIELAGWDYPKHLAGRAYAVVVHGDTNGVDILRRTLTDWLNDMDLISSGHAAEIGKYIGYYKPYATSHEDLDEYTELFTEVENAALSLAKQMDLIRTKKFTRPNENLQDPEQK